jgi:pimeloyl-ACP methyl ester carboxylesterase
MSSVSANSHLNSVLTEDGQRIAIQQYRNSSPNVIIIAHGFYNNKDTILFKGIAEAIHKNYDVITFDFRGHGKSSGLFSWTAEEEKDLRAVINYAKEKEYVRVGVIGFSLGAVVALLEASHNQNINSVIAVSAPADFWRINYHFWEKEMIEDLKLNLGAKGRGKGVRPGNPFLKKIRPIDIVDRIAPKPVLFLHGGKDWLIKPSHSHRLFVKAKEPKDVKIIDDGGHAERIFDAFPNQFEKICIDWFRQTL